MTLWRHGVRRVRYNSCARYYQASELESCAPTVFYNCLLTLLAGIFSITETHFILLSLHSSKVIVWKSFVRGFYLQVHVRHWPCIEGLANGPCCVCGIAAREGNTIVGVDMCTDSIPHYFTYTRSRLPSGYGIQVSPSGYSFGVSDADPTDCEFNKLNINSN